MAPPRRPWHALHHAVAAPWAGAADAGTGWRALFVVARLCACSVCVCACVAATWAGREAGCALAAAPDGIVAAWQVALLCGVGFRLPKSVAGCAVCTSRGVEIAFQGRGPAAFLPRPLEPPKGRDLFRSTPQTNSDNSSTSALPLHCWRFHVCAFGGVANPWRTSPRPQRCMWSMPAHPPFTFTRLRCPLRQFCNSERAPCAHLTTGVWNVERPRHRHGMRS